LLTPDTSVLVAWAEAPLDAETTAKLGPTTDVQRLILGFNPVRGGAILEAA
jgi:hypothetical protein